MKYCIKCQMDDPLPHDERLGQAIYNYLRPNKEKLDNFEQYQSLLADKLFNVADLDLQRFIQHKFWCAKCKRGDL